MSRPWILSIVFCSLIAGSAAVGWGQDYLDLPASQPQSKPTTLADRLMSLKGKFSRDKSSQQAKPQQSTSSRSSSKSNPRSPRYRNTAQASAHAQRARRNSTGAALHRSTKAPIAKSQDGTQPSSGDLLPEMSLFSRSNAVSSKSTRTDSRLFAPAVALPRAGSAINQRSTNAQPRVARKSPKSSRANELNAALADLTKAQATQKNATQKSPTASATVLSNTLDLRKALLDDDEDSIAAEAAQAVDAASEPVVPKLEKPASMPTAKKAVESAAEKTEAPAIAQPVLETPKPQPAVVESAPAQPTVPLAVTPEAITPSQTTVAPPAAQPVLVQPQPKSDPFENAAKHVFSKPQPATTEGNPMRPFSPTTQAIVPTPVSAKPQQRMLQTTQQAVIVSHVEGPRSILVGREATYQVTLENTSKTPATNLLAVIDVPEWAELVDAMSTSGVVERSGGGEVAGGLEWNLSNLAGNSSQSLRLRLIPRSGRPLQLGVRWSQAPTQLQTIVEVQEPKLELAISGPREVRFGKAQRYRLTLRNPGTGLSEGVSLRLIPPGGDAGSAITQQIGNLKAGEVKDLDLELTAREAGDLLIQASAVAEGGLKAETTKKVLCRKPGLQVDWRGPDKKYAGTEAAYYFRVSNPGTAATDPIEMSVKLPAEAEFVSASQGFSINTTTGVVSWRLASIDVKEEQFMQLRCKISRPGVNDFEVKAKTADGGLRDSKAFQTNVVALADLKLEVSDPQGPLPMGEAVVYEIRVRNRGTTDAENINVVGLFSEGIEPTTVEGAQFTLRDGRVSFHPIKSLPAGREVLLRIHATANQEGTHVFRTEVTCPKLDIKLAAEETTRFFKDEHRWADGETPYSAERAGTLKR